MVLAFSFLRAILSEGWGWLSVVFYCEECGMTKTGDQVIRKIYTWVCADCRSILMVVSDERKKSLN